MKRKSSKPKPPAGTSIRFLDSTVAASIARASKLVGVGTSTFVREAAERRAEEVLEEHARSLGMCRECGRPRAAHGTAA